MLIKIEAILFVLCVPIFLVASIYYGISEGNWAGFIFLIICVGIPSLAIFISLNSSVTNATTEEEKKKANYTSLKRNEMHVKGYAITKESERGGLDKAFYHGGGTRYQLYSSLTNEKCYIDRNSDYVRWFLMIRSQYDGHLIEVMVRKYYEDKLTDTEIQQKINEMNPNRKFAPKVSSWLLDYHS